MPDAQSLNKENGEFNRAMVCKLVTIQIRLDLWNGIRTLMFAMEGMLEGELEDVRLLLMMVSLVPPSLSPIFLLRTLCPSTLGSTK